MKDSQDSKEGGSMKRYVIGNWKCHKTLDDGRRWFEEFSKIYRPMDDVDIIIAPSFIYMENLARFVRELGLENVYLAAQDISPFPKGPYTGAVAADMVRGFVDYVILGHSDRRRYFHEQSRDVANKMNEAVDANLKPIVCVDKPYAMSQLTALNDIDCPGMIIAYGPVDALNFRIPEGVQNVEETAAFISQIYPRSPVVYGGSLTPENAADYAHLKGLSGLFVGSASLEPQSFNAICQTMA